LFCQTYALTRAKRELAKHMTELVLKPKETPEGWTFEVTGDWKLLPDQKCVIWMVARDSFGQNYIRLTVPISAVLRLKPDLGSA
jgi:hypothetical protein